MRSLRIFVVVAILAGMATAAAPAFAVRVATRPLLLGRTAVSGYAGGALPVGEFSDSRPGYGNHADWPLDWAAEIEYFFGRTWSLGFSIANSTWQDKDDPLLETDLDTYSGFLRVVIPTASAVRPYLRAGMGGVDLEFLDVDERFEAESSFSFHVGGGLLWLPARWMGISAQALYYDGSTDDAYVDGFYDIDGNPVYTVVGFDVQYWSFTGGLSFFFP